MDQSRPRRCSSSKLALYSPLKEKNTRRLSGFRVYVYIYIERNAQLRLKSSSSQQALHSRDFDLLLARQKLDAFLMPQLVDQILLRRCGGILRYTVPEVVSDVACRQQVGLVWGLLPKCPSSRGQTCARFEESCRQDQQKPSDSIRPAPWQAVSDAEQCVSTPAQSHIP